ncbi:MAG TPA: glycosyltransferase family 4 protein [Bradyrhizobium sp.]|uniref:glycosyltransferase family 4 protein n=1 Tax=Bradyrhizobium sp. TaxID=376 RepID=UPI002D7EE616|nr:glycosyltransferase family 4 protein [Bradyrhizobium sp.]HET7886758.1 glycosyltransferase family 4 protein [Bradyrhizobium sp.]
MISTRELTPNRSFATSTLRGTMQTNNARSKRMVPSILWLGRIIPIPLNAGDRVYSAHLAGAVARQGAQVVFLGLDNPDEKDGNPADLEPSVYWKRIPGVARSRLRSLFSSLPMVGARFATTQYRNAIASELALNNYDVVVFDQYAMSWAVPLVQTLARNRPFFVQVAHNFETAVNDQIARNFSGDFIRKWLLQANARKTRRAEQNLALASQLLVTLTEEDRTAFAEINPSLASIVLPPGYANVKQASRTVNADVPRRAIIVGSFRWIAKQINLERLLEAASAVFVPNHIELHIVGFVPEAVLSRLRSRFPWVVFCGFVDDLGEMCRNARIALIPEEVGGGFKLKTLDYIFSRVPVASVETALNGIPAGLRSSFLVERDIETLLGTIVAVIDDVERLDRMQRRAFELAEDMFSWDANASHLLEALTPAIGRREAERPLLKSA